MNPWAYCRRPADQLYGVSEQHRRTFIYLYNHSILQLENFFITSETFQTKYLKYTPFKKTSTDKIFQPHNQIHRLFAFFDTSNILSIKTSRN